MHSQSELQGGISMVLYKNVGIKKEIKLTVPQEQTKISMHNDKESFFFFLTVQYLDNR